MQDVVPRMALNRRITRLSGVPVVRREREDEPEASRHFRTHRSDDGVRLSQFGRLVPGCAVKRMVIVFPPISTIHSSC